MKIGCGLTANDIVTSTLKDALNDLAVKASTDDHKTKSKTRIVTVKLTTAVCLKALSAIIGHAIEIAKTAEKDGIDAATGIDLDKPLPASLTTKKPNLDRLAQSLYDVLSSRGDNQIFPTANSWALENLGAIAAWVMLGVRSLDGNQPASASTLVIILSGVTENKRLAGVKYSHGKPVHVLAVIDDHVIGDMPYKRAKLKLKPQSVQSIKKNAIKKTTSLPSKKDSQKAQSKKYVRELSIVDSAKTTSMVVSFDSDANASPEDRYYTYLLYGVEPECGPVDKEYDDLVKWAGKMMPDDKTFDNLKPDHIDPGFKLEHHILDWGDEPTDFLLDEISSLFDTYLDYAVKNIREGDKTSDDYGLYGSVIGYAASTGLPITTITDALVGDLITAVSSFKMDKRDLYALYVSLAVLLGDKAAMYFTMVTERVTSEPVPGLTWILALTALCKEDAVIVMTKKNKETGEIVGVYLAQEDKLIEDAPVDFAEFNVSGRLMTPDEFCELHFDEIELKCKRDKFDGLMGLLDEEEIKIDN